MSYCKLQVLKRTGAFKTSMILSTKPLNITLVILLRNSEGKHTLERTSMTADESKLPCTIHITNDLNLLYVTDTTYKGEHY